MNAQFDAEPCVTVLVPCRNEARYIADCLQSILASDYSKSQMEILVVDGMSDDETRDIIKTIAADHPSIRLLDNPQRITPHALNLGIQQAKGDFIIRMDAHATYPSDYISKLISWQLKTGADNVGGVRVSVPADGTPLAVAIACGISHPFGVGTSYYQTGAAEPRWVDTVWGGCFKKDLFKTIGLFDERFVRNQDDEFNHRLLAKGGRILLVSDVQAFYVARNSLSKLWRMYWQYGYFKPLTAYKLGMLMTGRQLIPAAFVVVLATLALIGVWNAWSLVALAGLVGAYLMANLVTAIQIGLERGWPCGLWMPIVFVSIHFGYGIGFLQGLVAIWVFRKHPGVDGTAIPLSR